MSDEYIRKADAVDRMNRYGSIWMEYTEGMSKHEVAEQALKASKQAVIDVLENLPSADVIPYSIESDGTLTITVPKGTKRIGRILIEEDGTQYGGLFYPDTGGCFLSSMERSEQDGNKIYYRGGR